MCFLKNQSIEKKNTLILHHEIHEYRLLYYLLYNVYINSIPHYNLNGKRSIYVLKLCYCTVTVCID